jgi:hypothetical protein
MISWQIKYHRKINLAVCFSYCVINLLSVFHYHNYDFNYVHSVEEQNNGNNESLSWQQGSGIECVVHQNYNSLNTVTGFSNFASFIFFPQQLENLPQEHFKFLSSVYLSTTKLRAPPIYYS